MPKDVLLAFVTGLLQWFKQHWYCISPGLRDVISLLPYVACKEAQKGW